VAHVEWLGPGQVGAALAFLHRAGVRDAVMAGKVPKQQLLSGRLELDERAREIFSGLPDLRDASVLGALAGALEAEGFRLRPQAEWVPELLAPEGVLGRVHPTPSQWGDLSFGWPIARALAAWDIGQTIVVQDRTVLAVESIEGTDETIRRGGRLGRLGLCIVKVARPEQDPRFDLPTIGPATLAAAAEAGAQVLAVEARRTLVLDREALVRHANQVGIALVGIPEAGPRPGREEQGAAEGTLGAG
jgi:hypothetical protein